MGVGRECNIHRHEDDGAMVAACTLGGCDAAHYCSVPAKRSLIHDFLRLRLTLVAPQRQSGPAPQNLRMLCPLHPISGRSPTTELWQEVSNIIHVPRQTAR